MRMMPDQIDITNFLLDRNYTKKHQLEILELKSKTEVKNLLRGSTADLSWQKKGSP